MTLLTFIFRAILFLFAFRLAAIVLRAFFGGLVKGLRPAPGPTAPGGPAPQGRIEELVKDPVCGLHIARSSAVSGRYRGAPAYFCSAECAEKAGDS